MAAFPPSGPTSLQNTIPSYLYVQYDSDPDLQALVDAYNQIVQNYVTYLNALNLPIYTSPSITGALLDWVGIGLYGIPRPNMPTSGDRLLGPINTFTINTLAINQDKFVLPPTNAPATDDIYKRVLTWNFYKGDGMQFTIPWLKRRITRFCLGVNGVDPGIDTTYDVGVTSGGGAVLDIVVTTIGTSQLQFGIESGVLALPFQFTYSVTI